MHSILQRTLPWMLAAFLLTGCGSEALDHSGTGAIKNPGRSSQSATPALTPATESPADHSVETLPGTILAWDATKKVYRAKAGEESALFTFNVTNVSPAEVVIEDTSTSCGCTVAELPADPWKLAPGAHGQIQVTMEFNGQIGDVSKEVTVFTSKGDEVLTVESIIPEPVYPNAAK